MILRTALFALLLAGCASKSKTEETTPSPATQPAAEGAACACPQGAHAEGAHCPHCAGQDVACTCPGHAHGAEQPAPSTAQ